jgi:toxin CcdB
MALFDVYGLPSRKGYMLDCQADALSDFKTRVVVPLLPVESTPRSLARLNPVFEIEGTAYAMATHLIASVPVKELGAPVMSLCDQDSAILGAIDMLVSGY